MYLYRTQVPSEPSPLMSLLRCQSFFTRHFNHDVASVSCPNSTDGRDGRNQKVPSEPSPLMRLLRCQSFFTHQFNHEASASVYDLRRVIFTFSSLKSSQIQWQDSANFTDGRTQPKVINLTLDPLTGPSEFISHGGPSHASLRRQWNGTVFKRKALPGKKSTVGHRMRCSLPIVCY